MTSKILYGLFLENCIQWILWFMHEYATAEVMDRDFPITPLESKV